jgi:hypothetical protein
MEYEDAAELTRYVWDHYERLMTAFEQRVGRAIIWRMKKATSPRLSGQDDPEINAALVDGPEAFRRLACRRVLAEHGADVFINRCPRCDRVVRTPQARQCFWCGHDWHTTPP